MTPFRLDPKIVQGMGFTKLFTIKRKMFFPYLCKVILNFRHPHGDKAA
jgi:hypothetical protein